MRIVLRRMSRAAFRQGRGAWIWHDVTTYRGIGAAQPPRGGWKKLSEIPANVWWIGKEGNKYKLFITCESCRKIMTLSDEYFVHPLGYLDPCVKCEDEDCADEGFRYLMDWTPIKAFTKEVDWRHRKKRLKDRHAETWYESRQVHCDGDRS